MLAIVVSDVEVDGEYRFDDRQPNASANRSKHKGLLLAITKWG